MGARGAVEAEWGQINPRDYCHTARAPRGPFGAAGGKKTKNEKERTRGSGLTSNLFLIEHRLQWNGGDACTPARMHSVGGPSVGWSGSLSYVKVVIYCSTLRDGKFVTELIFG